MGKENNPNIILLRRLQLKHPVGWVAGTFLACELRVSLIDGPVLTKYLTQ